MRTSTLMRCLACSLLPSAGGFGVGPGGSWEIPVEVDYELPFPAADHRTWQTEYEASVRPAPNDCWFEENERWTLAEGVQHELIP